MKSSIVTIGLFLLSLSCSNPLSEDVDHSEKIIESIENQYNSFLKINAGQNEKSGIYLNNGYFAGVNWNLFILSGDKRFEALANESLSSIEKHFQDSPDCCRGHELLAGFATGIKITQNDAYKKHLIETVKAMTHEFDPETGWFYLDEDSKSHTNYNFGFESIMKLESLFYVARLTADPVYYNIAIKHAEVILDSYFKHHSTADFPGEIMEYSGGNENSPLQADNTFQTDDFKLKSLIVYSCGLIFRETGDSKYRNLAESFVTLISEQLNYSGTKASGADLVQYINDNNVDITSLAVLTSALYDLSLSLDNKSLYIDKASQFISVLSTKKYFEYQNWPDKASLFHGNNTPKDVDLSSGGTFFIKEYFLLEALNKKQKLEESAS